VLRNRCKTRARPLKFFCADTDVFYFTLPITDADIFVLLKQYLFCLMSQNKHSWSYFAFSQKFSSCSWKALQSILFFRSHEPKKIISQVTIILWGKIYTSILTHEAKYTFLELFCHQLNMIGWTAYMTSLDSMTVPVDYDVCKWLSLIDK